MKKEKETKSKILIFDFDGTIADTKTLYYKTIFHELKFMGFSEKQVYLAIDIGLSLRKTFSKLGFSYFKSWFLKNRIMKNLEKHIQEVKKCKDVDSIKNISGRKILVTNSLKEFAIPVLKHLKLKKEFLEIYGADDFDDKTEFIKEYTEKKKLGKKNVFYIGDRAADVLLAKKAGIISVIVSGKCAWNSRKEVLKEGPDFIIDDLADIKKII